MKWFFVLTFVLTSGAASFAVAAIPFSGELVQVQGTLFVDTNQKCGRYQLIPKNAQVSQHIRKLSPGDSVEASGILENDTCKAYVESIEYVGLRRLLGYWVSKSGFVSVRDFSSMSFYPAATQELKNQTTQDRPDPITYRYSVTPSGGKEWVVFLSNAEGTSFATLMFSGKIVTMKIFDSETGALNQTLRLSKWADLKP